MIIFKKFSKKRKERKEKHPDNFDLRFSKGATALETLLLPLKNTITYYFFSLFSEENMLVIRKFKNVYVFYSKLFNIKYRKNRWIRSGTDTSTYSVMFKIELF